MEQPADAVFFRPGVVFALDERVMRAIKASPANAQQLLAAYGSRGRSVAAPSNVAVIPIFGVITQYGGWFGTSTEEVQAALRAALAARDVTSIVLLVNSPGGEVYGVDELATAVRAAAQVKPVVTAISSLAASAGYYAISGSTEVLIGPSAEAGSIGVYGEHVDLSRALDAQGVTVTIIASPESKADGNPYQPLSDPARASMRESVDRYYSAFVNAVSLGRRVPPGVVKNRWAARVYGATAAVELGLADRVGTLDVALTRASALADRSAANARAARLDQDVRMITRSRGGDVRLASASGKEQADAQCRAILRGRGADPRLFDRKDAQQAANESYVEDKIRARERGLL